MVGTSTQKSLEREYKRDLTEVSGAGSPFSKHGIFMTDGGSESKRRELDFGEQRIDSSPMIHNSRTPGRRKPSHNPKLLTPSLELSSKISQRLPVIKSPQTTLKKHQRKKSISIKNSNDYDI